MNYYFGSWTYPFLISLTTLILIIHQFNCAKLEYRIQNGFQAKAGEFPMIVLLVGSSHFCTGTLVAKNKVLTAAHCTCAEALYTAYANLTNINNRDNSSYVQARKIVGVDYPKKYSRSCQTLFNGNVTDYDKLGGPDDIAIVTLKHSFDLKKYYVEIAKLHLQPKFRRAYRYVFYRTPAYSQGLVLGFGRNDAKNKSGQLYFGLMKLATCPSNIPIMTKGALCANTERNKQFPDVGDSGGPLFNIHGKVIGVTSIHGYQWVVFSSVQGHSKFIKNHLLST